jgi:hypothetical protein
VRRKKYNPLAVIIFLVGLAASIMKSHMTGLAEEYFSMAATAGRHHGRIVSSSTYLA